MKSLIVAIAVVANSNAWAERTVEFPMSQQGYQDCQEFSKAVDNQASMIGDPANGTTWHRYKNMRISKVGFMCIDPKMVVWLKNESTMLADAYNSQPHWIVISEKEFQQYQEQDRIRWTKEAQRQQDVLSKRGL